MQIQSTRDGLTAIAEAAGLIDTKASQEFEKHVVGLFDAGVRSVVIDLSQVGLITSSGIRVLVMMAQRLQRNGGALVLCALSSTVRGVFDIAGLLTQFKIAGTRDEAVALLASLHVPSAASASASKLTRLVSRILAEDSAESSAAAGGDTGTQSGLTAHVVEVLQPSTRG